MKDTSISTGRAYRRMMHEVYYILLPFIALYKIWLIVLAWLLLFLSIYFSRIYAYVRAKHPKIYKYYMYSIIATSVLAILSKLMMEATGQNSIGGLALFGSFFGALYFQRLITKEMWR